MFILYSDKAVSNPCIDEWIFQALDHADRRWLNRDVSASDVKDVFLHIGVYKTAEPNGVLPLFYQKYWHIVGILLLNLYMEYLGLDMFPMSLIIL